MTIFSSQLFKNIASFTDVWVIQHGFTIGTIIIVKLLYIVTVIKFIIIHTELKSYEYALARHLETCQD